MELAAGVPARSRRAVASSTSAPAQRASSCRSTRVARLDRGVGPLTVNHAGPAPAVTISFNLAPGRRRSATRWPRSRRRRAEMLPADASRRGFQGTAQAFQ